MKNALLRKKEYYKKHILYQTNKTGVYENTEQNRTEQNIYLTGTNIVHSHKFTM